MHTVHLKLYYYFEYLRDRRVTHNWPDFSEIRRAVHLRCAPSHETSHETVHLLLGTLPYAKICTMEENKLFSLSPHGCACESLMWLS
eukprot:g21832.t1